MSRRTGRCTSRGRTTRTGDRGRIVDERRATFSAAARDQRSSAAFEFDPAAQGIARSARLPGLRRRLESTLYCSYMDDTRRRNESVRREVDGRRSTWTSTADAGRRRPVQPVARRRSGRTARSTSPTTTRRRRTLRRPCTRSRGRRTPERLHRLGDRERAAPTRPAASGVNLGNQYGDYEGIAALGGIVRPVWTDRRAGRDRPRLARRGLHGGSDSVEGSTRAGARHRLTRAGAPKRCRTSGTSPPKFSRIASAQRSVTAVPFSVCGVTSCFSPSRKRMPERRAW